MRRFRGVFLVVVLLAAASVVSLIAQSGARAGASKAKPYTTWTAYGGGPHSAQFTALSQINKSNVSQLQVAWTYPVTGTIVFNPIVVDDVMYAQGTGNAIVALDAATGKEIWTHPNQGGIGARGLNYWESPDRSDRRLIYLNAGHITALDARTGQTITSFGNNGRVDLRTALWRDVRNPLQTSNPGRIFDDVIIMSLPAQGAGYEANPADVQAYDVRTGKVRWVFHTIPLPGEFGYDTWPDGAFKTAGGVHNWSEMTVDEQNGIVFIPTGTGRFDFYGGNRHGANLFANSIVALDARKGTRLWHQQLVHHDLWDFDLPQAPKLLTIRQNGRNVDVVAQATKMGFVFVFERKTGRPIFPIEERPVPQTDVPGEVSWPTQPFPTKPAPFARQTFTEKDINPFLPPAELEAMRQKVRNARNEGLYHAAEPPRVDLDARPQRRCQLGQRRRRPDSRRDVHRLQEHAGDAAPGAQQRGADGRRRAGRWTAEPDHHAGRGSQAHRRGEGGARQGPGALHLALRLHAQPVQRDDGDRSAVVAAHRV